MERAFQLPSVPAFERWCLKAAEREELAREQTQRTLTSRNAVVGRRRS